MFMKATGIIRRIDNLGRLVIPKEIRKVLKIKESDPMEIFVGSDGEIVLKKYSPMADMSVFAQQYVEAVSQSLGLPVMITDRDTVIAVAGMPKKDILGSELHRELENVIDSRRSVATRKGEKGFARITEDGMDIDGEVIQPIIAEGDAIGAVVVIAKDPAGRIGDIEKKAAVIAASFLGKQMEV